MASISVSSNNNTNTNCSNIYRVGDYVYFESQQQQSGLTEPFQIRRIEELNKSANGNIEAKVMCFYRRRDLPEHLIALADKHQQQQLYSTSIPNSPSIKDSSQQKTVVVKSQVTTSKSIPFVDDQSNNKVLIFDVADSNKKEEKNRNLNNTDDQFARNNFWHGEQLKQRELFLSRQVETLATTYIRGKCTVNLYNETESLDSYLEKDDTFFYCLVFDPVQRTLLADKGEIRVGPKFQAEVLTKPLYNHGNSNNVARHLTTVIKKECLSDGNNHFIENDISKNVDSKHSSLSTMEIDNNFDTLVWTCDSQWNNLTDREIDQFLVVSRSLGTFARALDCTSSVKQPSLHMSAAAASRDITLFHAMDTLHSHGYELGVATCSLVPSTGPVLCRDEMEEWSASEANLFEEALQKYGKDFSDIRHDFLPWKTLKNIVEYYYMWKTTDRYIQQKRLKAVEEESKLKQIYMPFTDGLSKNLVNGNSSTVELYSKNTDGQLLPGVCDLCNVDVSQQWYPNTIGTSLMSSYQQNGVVSSKLCQSCFTHWKKYGGSRVATSNKKVMGVNKETSGDETMNQNVLANNGSVQMQMLTPHHLIHTGKLLHQPHNNSSGTSITTHIHKCTIIGCQAPAYKNKSQLLRHYSTAHGIGINSHNSNSTHNVRVDKPSVNNVDSDNGKLSPTSLLQEGLLQQNSDGPLNLNNNKNKLSYCNITGAVINQVASKSQKSQQPNLSSVATNSAIGTVAATGRPIMKTRTAFYLRCTSLAQASRRQAIQKAILTLLRQTHQKNVSSVGDSILTEISSTLIKPFVVRPRNVARRPFICVPQAAHTYKQEYMLSMKNTPIHEIRSYLKAIAVKTIRPGVTQVANALIAARKGRGLTTTASDLAVPDWLFQKNQSLHHISSTGLRQGKHSLSRSSTGRVAFPKPPKAPDGSLVYKQVPNKQEATAIVLNPVTTSLFGTLGQPESVNTNSVSGTSNNLSAVGFEVSATSVNYKQSSSSSSNKRRIYELDSAVMQFAHQQPKPQVGPPSKRIHRQRHTHQQQIGGAVDNMLASIIAYQKRSGPLQLNKSGNLPHHYRTPSMARSGRKHVISWTDAPDDLYYRCTMLSKSLRKGKINNKELKRSARKPWQPIATLHGISFPIPIVAASISGPSVNTLFDISTTGNGCSSSVIGGSHVSHTSND